MHPCYSLLSSDDSGESAKINRSASALLDNVISTPFKFGGSIRI